MAATVSDSELQRPTRSPLRTLMHRSAAPRALAGLALGFALVLALPGPQAVSRGLDAEPAASSGAAALSADDTTLAPAAERRPTGSAPSRPMTSGDRQAIFMVLMLQGPNASSQILGLTR